MSSFWGASLRRLTTLDTGTNRELKTYVVCPAEKEGGGVVHVRNICSAAPGVRPVKVTVYSMKCAAVHLSPKDNKTR